MMRISRYQLLFLSISLIIFTGSCMKSDWAQKEQDEQDLIAKYIREHNISEDKKQVSGIYFIEEKAGTGLTPQKNDDDPKLNDYVIINYTGRFLENDKIHETSYDSLKDEWENAILYTNFVYGPLRFQYGYSIAGINEGLALMKEGGKAQIIIPSDMAFYDYNPMIYEIELLKVVHDPAQYDTLVLNSYFTQQNWDTAATYIREKNVYYKETLPHDTLDTHHFQAGDTLYFMYNSKLLDGYNETVTERTYDSNYDEGTPVKYIYGGALPNFPPGLRNALDTLHNLTKGTFVVPWKMAYGEQGLVNSRYGYTIVPKYQSLVFDIEVTSLKSANP